MDPLEKRIEDLIYSAIDAGEESANGNMSNANHVLNSEKESVIKDIATIRAEVTRLTAERDKMREAIEKVLFQVLHIENTGEVLVADIIAMREYLNPVLESEAPND